MQLVWNPNQDPNISRYGVYRKPHLDSSFVLINTAVHPDSTYLDESVEWNSHYYYAVTAIDSDGFESGFSNVVDTLMSTPSSNDLLVFTARAQGTDVILEWKAATDSNLLGYEVQRRSAGASGFDKIGYVRVDTNGGSDRNYRFVDEDPEPDTYYYRLKLMESGGGHHFSSNIRVDLTVPGGFHLYQNHPNPLNSLTRTTTISYTLPRSGHVKLTIYDVRGREVYKLVDGFQTAGRYDIDWAGVGFRGERVAAGIYYYKTEAVNGTQFRKMTILR
ncbi:fibronectin type III domain-containing protein [Nitrosomonas nitrosa]|uniref:fibronectin type III domain-containing protein n=1 Tax=Nitrosomonas nitrosa TaxID=52442 RepID=UPI0023F71BDB|nr:FlgD immunoglobulin-like domain containing protein [Nitrosomonas nitrosa]MCO6434647.1 T9SS type A sorting domain-containing protein [Nitrosomonas nitrosa]